MSVGLGRKISKPGTSNQRLQGSILGLFWGELGLVKIN